jgi:hypothetical protein
MAERPAGSGVNRLTARQQAVFDFIAGHIAAHGYPPTTRELAVACHLGPSSAAHRMLGVLERKGYVTRTPGAKRTLAIAPPQVDRDRLSPFVLEIMATAMGWQDVAVERSLEAAQETRDAQVRSVLIRDALGRHEITVQICRSLELPALGQAPRPAVDELRWFRQRVPWPYFVVDHLVYNRAVTVGTQPLEAEIPELARLWDALRRLAEAATAQSEAWFEDLRADADADLLAGLQTRGERLLEMMSRTALYFDREPFLGVELPR